MINKTYTIIFISWLCALGLFSLISSLFVRFNKCKLFGHKLFKNETISNGNYSFTEHCFYCDFKCGGGSGNITVTNYTEFPSESNCSCACHPENKCGGSCNCLCGRDGIAIGKGAIAGKGGRGGSFWRGGNGGNAHVGIKDETEINKIIEIKNIQK